ncbi:MAG: hypothetical protein KKA67_10380 [Spirochaetes bacterium]|nr:hypothetical protein [Spirochaetota bacterium]MBU1078886.1 hypothetical protein [Spirochaetota bacterium]
MKGIRIAALGVALVAGIAAYGDEGGSGRTMNAASFDPVAVIFNLYSGSYERALGDRFSVKGSLSVSPNFFWISDIGYFDASVEGRFYFGQALGGLLSGVDVGDFIKDRFLSPGIVGPYVGAFVGCLGASVRGWTAVDPGVPAYTFDADAFGLGAGASVGLKYVLFGSSLAFFAEPFVGFRLYGLVGGDDGWRYTDASGTVIPKPQAFEDGFDRSGVFFGVNVGVAF